MDEFASSSITWIYSVRRLSGGIHNLKLSKEINVYQICFYCIKILELNLVMEHINKKIKIRKNRFTFSITSISSRRILFS